MFNTLFFSVIPNNHPSWSSNTVFIFRQLIQPWHPSSTLVHEAALAVLKICSGISTDHSDQWWKYSAALFERQKEYFDVNVANETRNATYMRLAKLAEESVMIDVEKVMALLKIDDQPDEKGELNSGNGVTADVKMVMKMARRIGAHVTPTVFLDGVEVGEISSSWSKEQWETWLGKNCG